MVVKQINPQNRVIFLDFGSQPGTLKVEGYSLAHFNSNPGGDPLSNEQPGVLQMVAQLAQLEATLKPVLPQITAKLVSDLLKSGTPAAKIAKAVGRKPSYVRLLASGERSLSAQQIVTLIRSQAASAQTESDRVSKE